MLTSIQKFSKSSLAKDALKSKKKLKIDKSNYMVSSDFYRVDMGAVIFRQPIHLVMDDIEWESIKLEHQIHQKYLKNLSPDPKLIDFSTDFGCFNTMDLDRWSTHSKILEGDELKKHLHETKLKDSFFSQYLLNLQKEEDNYESQESEETESEEDNDSTVAKGI